MSTALRGIAWPLARKMCIRDSYNADVLDDSLSGKLGLRTWGYSGNYASISLSELHYNDVKAPEKDPDGNYMTSFTDPDCRGGWSKAWSQNASNEGLSFEMCIRDRYWYRPGRWWWRCRWNR